MMSFYSWIILRHWNEDTPMGDLARDVYADKSFPKRGKYKDILTHLKECNACDGAIECFKKAWAEYVKE
jgi:uncharacterized protein YozE (UPF0346 family)